MTEEACGKTARCIRVRVGGTLWTRPAEVAHGSGGWDHEDACGNPVWAAPGLADRRDRPRSAQGAGGSGQVGRRRPVPFRPTSPVQRHRRRRGAGRGARSAGAPIVPHGGRSRGWRCRPRGRPWRADLRAGRPRRRQLLPDLRPLPDVHHRPLESVRPRGGNLRPRPDLRRHQPATTSTARISTSWPRSARSPSTASSTRPRW